MEEVGGEFEVLLGVNGGKQNEELTAGGRK